MNKVAIIDYGSGNLRSAAKAFEKVSQNESNIIVTSDPNDLVTANHIVLPGVGAFADCIAGLKNIQGMVDALKEQVLIKKKPFLGICVGMQLLAEYGEEHGISEGLGWIKGKVVSIPITAHDIKVPHMGWNELNILKSDHPLLKDIKQGEHAYFVHSYHFTATNKDVVAAEVTHGINMAAILVQDNIMATQFHPEKSQNVGQQLIRNFLKI